jgi:hypothetical protein
MSFSPSNCSPYVDLAFDLEITGFWLAEVDLMLDEAREARRLSKVRRHLIARLVCQPVDSHRENSLCRIADLRTVS